MRPFYTILTNYGKTALAEALAAQQPLKIPYMAVGDGAGEYYDPIETQTNLRNEQWRGDLNDLRTDEELQGQVIAEAIIPHGIDGDWTAREIGLFDGKGGLVAVGKYPETYIPPKLSGAKSQIYISIVVKIDNVAAVELIINHDTVLASKQYVSDTTIGRKERAFTQRPAGIGLTDFVSVKDYGAKGDGVTDDTDAIDAARMDSNIIKFPYTTQGYVYKKPVQLNGETWIGEGVGRRWGNTAPTILFSGFNSEWAISSKTKTNTLCNLLFRPLSWDLSDGFIGGGLNVDGIINIRDCGIFGFKTNNLQISSTGTNETWLSTFENTWFGYSGEHGVVLKNSANSPCFFNCSSNWSGSNEFMKPPTIIGEFDGLYVYADRVAESGVTAPENMILIGGDWSYNSRYGINIQSGHGGTIRPGYLEHNLKNGVFLGGTAKGYDITLGHVGQSLETDLESPYTTTLAGNYITMPNKVKLNGIDRGIGHNFGDNDTDIPVRALDSEATTHKMLTASWSGVFGSIMKLMDKAGNMIFKSKSDDSRTMSIKLDGVRLEGAQPIIHRLVTRAALEFTTLPEPGIEYQNSFVKLNSDNSGLYYCVWINGAGYRWKKIAWS